jgi:carboxypeptidase family protein
MERAAFTFVIAGVLAFGGFAQTRPARDSPPTKTERTGIISGRVVAADSGEPIRKARVTAGSSAAPAVTMSIGRDGVFSIDGLPAADYLVAATNRARDEDEWRDPDFLSVLERTATRVYLVEGESVTLQLRRP